MKPENIKFVQPNMTRFYDWGITSTFYYNLCYAGTAGTPNSLVKTDPNGVRLGTYSTDTELTTPVLCLDYDGINFFSLQRITSVGGAAIGSIIRRWSLDTGTSTFIQTGFRSFYNSTSYTYTFNCLSVEYYWLNLNAAVYITDNKAEFRYPEDVPQISQVQIGNQMRIGPNATGNYFYGTVTDKQTTGGQCWVEFSTNFNAAYSIGNDCFIETGIYVFNSWAPGIEVEEGLLEGTINYPYGTLHILNPTDFSTREERTSGVYKNISACTFGIVEGLNRIGYYNKTCCLFLLDGLTILVSDLSDLDTYLASLVVFDNYYTSPNDIIPVYDMVYPLDSDPFDAPEHPTLQLLQYKWRDGNTYSTWSQYNYVSVLLEPQITTSNIMLEPAVTATGSLCVGRCTLVDQYDFGWADHTVTWSTTDPEGEFIDSPWVTIPGEYRRIDTDLNGISRVWYWTGPSDITLNLSACTILQLGGTCA